MGIADLLNLLEGLVQAIHVGLLCIPKKLWHGMGVIKPVFGKVVVADVTI